jgi:DNA-binding response OmpR family regulator
MNKINLSILGSKNFSDILNEIQFNNVLNVNNQLIHNNKKILIKILFVENLIKKDVKNYLSKNEPIVLLLNQKDYLKKNNFSLLDFHISLQLPIEILSLKEIINILITKYNFFQKSKIIIKDYQIDCNERSIIKNEIKIKLTEKELDLILMLNNNNGLAKSFLLKSIWKHNNVLDTHVFETLLHRFRKKINKYFEDKNFIIEKNSLYYLSN